MSFSKNQKIELDIHDMTKEGLGIAKIDSQVFFVKDAIVGDKVSAIITKVSSNVIYAKTIKIICKSKYRVESKCKVANSCGGCQLLNLDYEKQLELKKNSVINIINKIGKIDLNELNKCYDGIYSMDIPHRFRNKMQMPFAIRNGNIIYGFYAERTHHIIEFDHCLASFKGSDAILDIIKNAIIKYNFSIYDENTNEGVFREVLVRCGNESNEISLTYIINDKNYEKNIDLYKKFDEYIVEKCGKIEELGSTSNVGKIAINSAKFVTSTLNINTSKTNVLFGNKNIILRGTGYIEDCIGDVKYHISPESFYQVNMMMTKVLYDKVIEYANFSGNENVLDLYCGIGTISLYVARHVKKVLGIEIVEKAIENAKENAQINDIKNADFICEDITRNFTDDINNYKNEDYENVDYYDVVIVDPPRRGLDEKVINYITSIEPRKLIYVSCDPATLARDINILSSKEYTLKKFANVDMFPHTMHIETVALLNRN